MEDVVYEIKRGEVPYVEEIYFEECCNCILSTVNAVFMQDRGETSFEDVYQKTRELCIYHKQEMLYRRVTQSIEENIKTQLAQLEQQVKEKNGDILTAVDRFWTFMKQCIQTVSYLLIYLSKTEKDGDLVVYSLNIIRNYFMNENTEDNIIAKIYSAIINCCQVYRLSLLEHIKEDMEIETVNDESEEMRIITNIVGMLDTLDSYSQLESQYYRSIQSFYRTYAYELLINSSITVFLDCIQRIVSFERTICKCFFNSRNISKTESETLATCIHLFEEEILTKGLGSLMQTSQFSYLHQLYQFYSVIQSTDLLKTEIMKAIENRETEIFTKMTIPEIVALIKCYSRMIEECFDNNSSFTIGIKTSISNIINHNIDKCSEILVQWIHKCVCDYHENQTPLPAGFISDITLLIGYMNQKESFETLYRRLLKAHIIAYNDQLLTEETEIIDELKKICGNVFVSRLDSLAKDALSSREFAEYLKQNDPECGKNSFHIVSKDSSYKQSGNDVVVPPLVMWLKQRFEKVYFSKYNSRVIQFLYEESEYTLEYRNVDLIVNYYQYMILECFQKVDLMSIGDIQTVTNLPVGLVKETVMQLVVSTILQTQTEGELNNGSMISINPTPSLPEKRLNLVPAVQLSLHTHSVASTQDVTAMHRTKLDAAIVRVMKKEKFLKYTDLEGRLSSLLDFIPDDNTLKERVDQLISKDYISRDEKDESILVYQP